MFFLMLFDTCASFLPLYTMPTVFCLPLLPSTSAFHSCLPLLPSTSAFDQQHLRFSQFCTKPIRNSPKQTEIFLSVTIISIIRLPSHQFLPLSLQCTRERRDVVGGIFCKTWTTKILKNMARRERRGKQRGCDPIAVLEPNMDKLKSDGDLQ
ncbi:hypothetical protein EJ02DRAFT_171498 [Clathrospora elynae]|uniref:Uncharacterized protein n=1 Tax=Clathrospora elynae TaxID=706981 RepID=A0A6A5T360_9PLEO|nr:hypothetical protein EJ02DRAFT_171498 [Clathrospora elynae]